MKRGTNGTNAQCVLSGLPVRKARAQACRHEHRQPSRSFMPTQPRSRFPATGAVGLDARRSRVSAKPKPLSLRRQSGGPSGRRHRVTGLAQPPDRSVTTKSQANLVWSVSPASFTERSAAKAGRAHGYCSVLGDMRSIAPFSVSGCDRAVFDCLASLQPAERTQRELASS